MEIDMKFPFGSKTKEKKPRKQPKSLKQVLSDAWVRELKTNPDLLKRVAAKEAGYYDLVDDGTDPIEKIKQRVLSKALEEDPAFAEQVKQEYVDSLNPSSSDGGIESELEDTISGAVIEKIRLNPKLVDTIVEKRIGDLMKGEKSHYGRTTDLVREIEGLKQLKEVLGEESESKGEGFFTPDMVKSLLGDQGVVGLLGSLLGRSGSAQRTYVVETPGGTREFSPEEYKLYLEQRQRGELPAPFSKVLESAQTVSPVSPPVEGQAQTHVQIVPSPPFIAPAPPSAPSLNISSWLPYLEQEPEVFVALLEEKVLLEGIEGERAKFTLSILKTKTVDELLALLQPFKAKDGEIAQAIEALEAKKEWLEELMKIVKGEKEEDGESTRIY